MGKGDYLGVGRELVGLELFKGGVPKPWSVGQIWPLTFLFFMACELRMAFTF